MLKRIHLCISGHDDLMMLALLHLLTDTIFYAPMYSLESRSRDILSVPGSGAVTLRSLS